MVMGFWVCFVPIMKCAKWLYLPLLTGFAKGNFSIDFEKDCHQFSPFFRLFGIIDFQNSIMWPPLKFPKITLFIRFTMELYLDTASQMSPSNISDQFSLSQW